MVSDTTLDCCEAARIDKIDFVDENDVGERELFLRFRRPVDLFEEMLRVSNGDDGVELRLASDVLIDKERLCHRRRVCEPRSLDDDAVKGSAAPHQTCDDTNKIAPNGAANTTVVHLEYLFVRVDDEIIVDTDLSEFVHDDSKLLAMRLRENAV